LVSGFGKPAVILIITAAINYQEDKIFHENSVHRTAVFSGESAVFAVDVHIISRIVVTHLL
jgi:hypothetical protein